MNPNKAIAAVLLARVLQAWAESVNRWRVNNQSIPSAFVPLAIVINDIERLAADGGTDATELTLAWTPKAKAGMRGMARKDGGAARRRPRSVQEVEDQVNYRRCACGSGKLYKFCCGVM